MSLKALFIPLTAFLLTSCDCQYYYHYEVENQSSSTIKVKWEAFAYTTTGLMDSVEIIPGDAETLFMRDHGIEPCKDGPFPFYVDVSFDLISIQITRGDSVATKLDYRENEQWVSEDSEGQDAFYKAVVVDSSF